MEWQTDDDAMADFPVWSLAAPARRSLQQDDARTAIDAAYPLDANWLSLLALTGRYGTWRLAYCWTFKRWVDCLVAILALIVLAPILLVVSIAILGTMRSPVVFKQRRIGKGGATFVVYKFRTMIAERRQESQPFGGVERRVRHKSADDPRVTRIGHILRKTSLDEVPQLINVIRGEMALVGPRPELPEIVAGYQPWQHQRHLVRPGLTGWWQVQGRSDRPMHENTEMDLHYVARMSPGFDLRILLRTLRVVLLRSGAF